MPVNILLNDFTKNNWWMDISCDMFNLFILYVFEG